MNKKTVPSLKSKTNELFYRWLSRPERTEQIKEVINIIRNSNRIPRLNELKSYKNELENVQTRSLQSSINDQYILGYQPNNYLNISNNNNRPKSPTGIHSPPMSPISRMPQSPKSPRQKHANFQQKNQVNQFKESWGVKLKRKKKSNFSDTEIKQKNK
ncbi:unnamed protein product [Brachionus calyciflorus]|uniref:Uncharacterized protein n=1 Tax=Brachionus calyciflorus TaxID=104777 RepID=A0A813T7K1_9BILA|nr:unnamed protein product [Brachionus calyciflorus]